MYNVSSEFLTAVKQPSRTVKCKVGIGDKTITNLALNGGFENNTTNWSVSNATITSVTSELNANVTNTAGYVYQLKTTIVGHKYYIRAKVKATSNLVAFGFGGTSRPTHTGSGNYEYISQLITATITSHNIVLQDNRSSDRDTIYMDDVTYIDLTDVYGDGNEPTKEFMDDLMKILGWFNTTKTMSNVYLDDATVNSYNIENSFGSDTLPTIGSTVAGKMSMTIINDDNVPQIIIGIPIRPYVAIDTGNGNYEWVALGVFYSDYPYVSKDKLTTKLDAYDILAVTSEVKYETTLTLPLTVNSVLTDITNRYGVIFAEQPSRPNPSLAVVPSGTVRQVISDMASLMTTNATVNDIGEVEFIFLNATGFEMDMANYVTFKREPDSIVTISQLQLKQGDEVLSTGTNNGFALQLETNQITSSAGLDVVYARQFPLNYYAYTMKAQGMPHLQIGDIVNFTYVMLDGSQNTIDIPILYHKFNYNGGMSSEFKASSPKQETTQVRVSTSRVADANQQTFNSLIKAISNATQLITGNEGGNVVMVLDENDKPQEIVICDTGDINTATHVWRWNNNGLGYSSNGYNGDFATAITADGHIVANFIDTGVLSADIIKTGLLQSFNGVSWINMQDGTFSLAGGKLTFNGTDFEINYNGTALSTELNNKANASDLDGLKAYFTFNEENMLIGRTGVPQQIAVDNVSVQFLDYANATRLHLLSLTGNGVTATGTFATQDNIPFPINAYVQIEGVVPTVYNGTWKVTNCTTSSVTFTATSTGTVTTLGTVSYGFKADPNAVAWINGQMMYIKDLQATNSLTVGNHQIEKYNNTLTLIKYVG